MAVLIAIELLRILCANILPLTITHLLFYISGRLPASRLRLRRWRGEGFESFFRGFFASPVLLCVQDVGSPKKAQSLRSYRVRLRGLPRAIDSNFLMEKLIACFARHQRNLYDSPEFVLVGVARFGRNLDLMVKAGL